MKIQDIRMYVMSGTGNTFRVSQWIKEIAGSGGVSAEVIMIDSVRQVQPEDINDRMTGILFPAHGLMAPWSMIKFLLRMPAGKGVPAFIVSTRGGIKTGPVVIPGAVGFGNFLAAIILMFKGYSIKCLFSLDMPVNMINIHWGMKRKNSEIILTAARQKVMLLMKKLLAGKRAFYIGNILWEFAWTFLMFRLIPLFPILYLIIGKMFMAKLMFYDEHCTGCGMCAGFCPNQAIEMKKVRGKMRPFWTYKCEVCLRCMGYCNKDAVVAGHSWGVILYYITAIPVISFLLKITGLLNFLPSFISGYWSWQLVSVVYIVPAMLISYRVFWMLSGIPFFNRVFACTSFTRYFRRYHEPETGLKDLLKENTENKTGEKIL